MAGFHTSEFRIVALIALLGSAVCLSSFCYGATVKQEALDLATYKDLTQIRLDYTREIFQKDIQALSARLENQDKRLDTQNSHIDQNLSILGVLLSALGIALPLAGLAGYFSVSRKARDEAKIEAQKEARKEAEVTANDWFQLHAHELQSRLDALQSKLQQMEGQAEVGFNTHIQRVQHGADLAIKEMQLSVSGQHSFKKNISELAATALSEAAIAAKNKPESEYTFKDWNNRAFDAYRVGDNERAARFWRDAADDSSASQEQVAQALVNAGSALTDFKQYDQAIRVYEEVIQRFSATDKPLLKKSIATSLNGKATCFGLTGRLEEFNQQLDALMSQLEADDMLSHGEDMAHAMTNKVVGLGLLKKHEEALELCEVFEKRFNDTQTLEIQSHLITVRCNKISNLWDVNRKDTIDTIYEGTLAQFGSSKDVEIKQELGELKSAKAFMSMCDAKEQWSDEEFRQETLNQAAALLNEALLLRPNEGSILGNQAYCEYLKSNGVEDVREKLVHMLDLDGQPLYEATLNDIQTHPVPEIDNAFRILLDDAWEIVKNRQHEKS
jgi:tetratricopeptide (TPR) repeat protein